MLKELLVSQSYSFIPIKCEDGRLGGAVLVPDGGGVHVLDAAITPEFGSLLQMAAGRADKSAIVFGFEDVESLRLMPDKCVFFGLAACVLDGGRSEARELTFERVAQNELSEVLEPLVAPPVGQALTVSQLKAAAQRGHVFTKLRARLKHKVQEAGLAEVVGRELKAAPIVYRMQLKGVLVDPRWGELVGERHHQAAQLAQQLREGLGIQSLSHEELVGALRSRGLEVTGTSQADLAPFMTEHIAQQIVAWHRMDSFVRGIGAAVMAAMRQSPDGRIRPRWLQIGCATGRMSCSSPNLLGVPREAEVRRLFIPAPGHVFVVADYSAIELRVLAELVSEEALIRLFNENGDPHALTAARLTGKTNITDEERKKAKAVIFGLVYGMGAETLCEYALVHYGVVMSLEEAKQASEIFYQTYPGIRRWHEQVRREMPLETRTLGGRVRYFQNRVDGYNARLASPIQGTVADALKEAMVMAESKATLRGTIVLAVHDELVCEVPVAVAEQAKHDLIKVMKEAMEKFVKKVPIVVKADVRSSWAEE